MEITSQQLQAIMPNCPYPGTYAVAANNTARKFGINSVLRWAAWLAIIAYESGELRYWSEIDGESHEYAPYWGRGPSQLTWEYMYKACGDYLGIDLVGNPDLVATDTQVGFDTAGWIFAIAPGFNLFEAYADDGDLWDIYLKVAGADNGTYAPRKAYYDKAMEVLAGGDVVAGVPVDSFINSLYKLLGAPYRPWSYGMGIPTWIGDGRGDPPPLDWLKTVGVDCADLVDFGEADNGLPQGGGTGSFGDQLIDQVPFEPASPGIRGAVAYRPYEDDSLDGQGHIAVYVDEHKIIQALGPYGVTDQFTDEETYAWGGGCEFTIYAKIPGIDYGNGNVIPPKAIAPRWMAVPKSSRVLVAEGSDWSYGWYNTGWRKDEAFWTWHGPNEV